MRINLVCMGKTDDKEITNLVKYYQSRLPKYWNFEIIEISLDKLEKEIIPFISDNNYRINVFPLNNKTGFVVNIEEFRRDLEIELEDYQ